METGFYREPHQNKSSFSSSKKPIVFFLRTQTQQCINVGSFHNSHLYNSIYLEQIEFLPFCPSNHFFVHFEFCSHKENLWGSQGLHLFSHDLITKSGSDAWFSLTYPFSICFKPKIFIIIPQISKDNCWNAILDTFSFLVEIWLVDFSPQSRDQHY